MRASSSGTTFGGRDPAIRNSRARGSIDTLPSGSLRVRVYAGIDPITHRQHYLTHTVPCGPTAARDAEAIQRRLVTMVEEGRHARTCASLTHLIERHLAALHASNHSRDSYGGYLRKHIAPLIGHFRIGAVTPEILDCFYAELARCRDHCHTPAYRASTPQTVSKGKLSTKKRRHTCRPLAPATIRKIHFLISAAYTRARRWQWIHASPTALATPPRKPVPNPQPPTPDDVTRILTHAWSTPWLGVLVWLAVITGARRGELCALRWTDVHPDRHVIHITRSIALDGTHTIEKDTKGRQRRHIALDPDTIALLVAYHEHRQLLAARAGLSLPSDAFLFSLAIDGRDCLVPSSLSQRYHRLVTHLGIHTTLHKLRHFSATELILANINIRTVASRLGHTDAGLTLNTYTAWISEADQHATTTLAQRIPIRLTPHPQHRPSRHQGVRTTKAAASDSLPAVSKYQPIADELRNAILNGTYPTGSALPTNHELTQRYHVSTGTIHRAITQLAHQHLITVRRGARAIVQPHHHLTHQLHQPSLQITPALSPGPLPFPTPRPAAPPRPIQRHHTARTQRQPKVAGQPRTTPAPR